MRQQLIDLRKAMAEHHVDWVIVLTDDFHASEYAGDHFKCRAYVSGFTGSAGTLLVGQEWAGLWTDGRYFLQAARQLSGTGIDLMKMAEPGVPTLNEYLSENLKSGQTVAFDGRTFPQARMRQIARIIEKAGAHQRGDLDLVGEIWTDRPALSAEPVWELDVKYAGKSRAEKLAQIRLSLQDAEADWLILGSLMDVCWLTNLRGNDVHCTPVVLSYFALSQKEAVLFVNPAVLSDGIRNNLNRDGVRVLPYDEITAFVRALPSDAKVMMDSNSVNSLIWSAAESAGVKILERTDPTRLPKAAKNEVEVANFREAHLKDGVAVTRLIYWLKTQVGHIEMDELSVARKLVSLRKEQEGYLGESFEPIIGYGPHGAIIHYSATPETNVPIEAKSFLLADTGGHYLEGTTDITRTIAMGPLTREEKEMYTRVLMGHLRLGAAVFKHGATGMAIDYLAHSALWEINMDYNHGTGHGVGYVLSVHEGPQSFFWRSRDGKPGAVLEPGMITSDEPGVYLEGKFGIRLENLTVVCDGVTNEYGRFLHLEYLTMVPFDLDAVVPELMSSRDIQLLNAYHQQVREHILPRLCDEGERNWLIHATRTI